MLKPKVRTPFKIKLKQTKHCKGKENGSGSEGLFKKEKNKIMPLRKDWWKVSYNMSKCQKWSLFMKS